MPTCKAQLPKLRLAAATTAVALAAAACSTSTTTASATSKSRHPTTVSGMTVAYLAPSLSISYWQWVYTGVQREAHKYKLKAVQYNASNSPSAQLADVHTAITAGAKMIVIGPVSSTSTPAIMAAAKAAHVPISFAGIGPPATSSNYTSSVTADNYHAGLAEGKFICVQAKKRGGNQIGMLSLPLDRENAKKYLKGAKQSIKSNGCDLVQIVQNPTLTVANAISETEALLTAHPSIKGIYGMYDEAGTGAGKVLQTRGLVGKVAIATADGSPTTVALLKRGVIQGLFLQEAVGQGMDATIQDVNSMIGKAVRKNIPLKEPLVTTKTLSSAQAQRVLRLTYPASAGSY